MATRITFASVPEETEYNVILYKAIVYTFTHSINAVQLKDFQQINEMLTVPEMQMIQREHDCKGDNAGAAKLLECLYQRPGWFRAFLSALDCDELRLKGFKPKFMELKERVDKEWLVTHPPAETAASFQTAAHPVANPSVSSVAPEPRTPTQSTDNTDARRMMEDRMRMPPPQDPARHIGMETDISLGSRAPHTGNGPPGLSSDFQLTMASSAGYERDAVEMETEGSAERPAVVPTRPAQSAAQEGRGEEMVTQPGEATGGEDQYVDDISATSADNDYEEAEINDPDHEYSVLSNISIERDACPMPVQPSDVPEQEVGVEATPQVLIPQQDQQRRQRQRPRTREEHPSLRQAISSNPIKDFEADFVIRQLSGFVGWCSRQEEHKVIHLIRPHQNMDGYYVIWYWNLAKRPTVCVARGGRVITFVVHKSVSTPPTFYFNRGQKRCPSLRELLTFHVNNGISYCPQGGEETIVQLVHPYSRQAATS